MREPIPLARPEITEDDIAAVEGVLRTPLLSGGPQLGAFESAVSQYVEVQHAVAVNSGTSALHITLRSLGLHAGDEVIGPSFAFAAVGNVLLQENLVPVFADIEAETFNIDPGSVERAVGPRTKAILFVHTFGIPARAEELRSIANDRGLVLIEDASEALGSSIGGKKAGVYGDAGIFAFYPNKMVTTGEGGVVVTQESQIADRCKRLRNQGRSASLEWYQQEEVGFSYRLSDINCALGVSQLRRIDDTVRRRQEIARWYYERLRGLNDIELVRERPDQNIGWFTYPVRLSSQYSQDHRDRVRAQLNSAGIGCARYFAPLHRQPVMQRRCKMPEVLVVTETVAARTFQLPFFNQLTEQHIDIVCDELKKAMAMIA